VRGSLRRRGPGTWQVRVFIGRDPETHRVRLKERTVRGSKKEAERVLAELVAEIDHGIGLNALGVTVEQLLDRWLTHNEADFSPSTVLVARGYIERTIVPLIGQQFVSQITTSELDAFYYRLRTKGGGGKPLSPATIRRVHGILRRALSQAVRWNLIRHNPAIDASPPRVPKHEIKPPAPQQVAEIFKAFEDTRPDLAAFVLLAAASGARRSELLALRWNDLDFDTGTLVISRGLVKSEHGLVEKDTKTHQARRLSLDPTTIGRLRSHRERMQALADAVDVPLGPDCYLFSDSVDSRTPWKPHFVSLAFRRAADSVGADDVRLHDLRHYVVIYRPPVDMSYLRSA
jgi:integrase